MKDEYLNTDICLRTAIWLVRVTYHNVTIWLVRDTYPNKTIWLVRDTPKCGSWFVRVAVVVVLFLKWHLYKTENWQQMECCGYCLQQEVKSYTSSRWLRECNNSCPLLHFLYHLLPVKFCCGYFSEADLSLVMIKTYSFGNG